MGRSRYSLVGRMLAAGLVLGLAAGCGADDESAAPPVSDGSASVLPTSTGPSSIEPTPAETSSGAAAYVAQHFVPRLTLSSPPWLPAEPAVDDRHFLTWVGRGADIDRAVRFMSPIGVYDPGHHPDRMSRVPRDYLSYILALRRYGAVISDRTTVDVDGHAASVMTAGTGIGMSGTLGCQARGLSADDCYGLQDYADIRLAVIDIDGRVVLAWARSLPDSPTAQQDFAAFDDLLATIRFG